MAPRDDLGHGAHLARLLHGVEPDPERARALEQYLVLTIDHGFNASTFTARVIASTGSDAGACFTGALGALAGPLHGGAPSRCSTCSTRSRRRAPTAWRRSWPPSWPGVSA